MSVILFNRRKYMEKRRPIGAPGDLADATITLSGNSFPYTGNPITPGVTVVYEGTTLTVNTDYFVSYADNTNVGSATATITGTGNYEGTVIKTFQITSAAASWDFDITKTQWASYKTLSTSHIAIGADDSEIINLTSYLTGSDGMLIKYKIPSGGNISSASEDSRSSVIGATMFDISSDGTKLILGKYVGSGTYGQYNINLWKINLSTPFDTSGVSASDISGDPDVWYGSGATSSGGFVRLSNDGHYFYLKGDGNVISIFHMDNSYELSNATSVGVVHPATLLEDGSQFFNGIDVSPDGKSVVASQLNGKIVFSSLSTPFDLRTATKGGIFNPDNNRLGCGRVNNAFTKLYLVNRNSYNHLDEFSLSK